MTPKFWAGKHVLITGHTGFKGGWLALWLTHLGAKVTGIALAPNTNPSFFADTHLERFMTHHVADIRDGVKMRGIIAAAKPDIVLHLAAQPLVRYSYVQPVETYETNVMGTVHVLEAVRACASVKAALIVTTDKCYVNTGQTQGYKEDDRLGGHDPYSNSKACSELVTEAYTRSFFLPERKKSIASARAGNVIGGGDWATDRLVPDLARALIAKQSPALRNPTSVRPWQHVLEPLDGYMATIESLWGKTQPYPIAYNFGPDEQEKTDVGTVANLFCSAWGGGITPHITPEANAVHEAQMLALDISKARKELHWKPRWNTRQAVEHTVAWYKAHAEGKDMRRVSLDQIELYSKLLA